MCPKRCLRMSGPQDELDQLRQFQVQGESAQLSEELDPSQEEAEGRTDEEAASDGDGDGADTGQTEAPMRSEEPSIAASVPPRR